jgi:ABC-type sugar transport system permease subunit
MQKLNQVLLARPSPARSQRRVSFYASFRRYRLPYLLLLPTLVLLLTFLFWPLLSLLWFGLRKTELNGSSQFVGLANYQLLFNEERFIQNLSSTLQYVIGVLVLSVPFAYFAAVLISSRLRGASLFRTVFLFPWIIAPVVSAILFRTLVDATNGPVTLLLKLFTGKNIYLMIDPRLSMLVVIVHSAWRSFPLEMLLIAAGITAIPVELYEAAKVDGAGWWQQFTRITLPLTKVPLFSAMLTITIYTLQDAEGAYALTGGGPGYSTEVTGVRLFKEAFLYFNVGLASSIGTILIIVSILFMIFYLRVLGQGEAQ